MIWVSDMSHANGTMGTGASASIITIICGRCVQVCIV